MSWNLVNMSREETRAFSKQARDLYAFSTVSLQKYLQLFSVDFWNDGVDRYHGIKIMI